MVLPFEPDENPRVRIIRDGDGKFIGYQDPDAGGRFISRADALNRLLFDPDNADLVDSFGNHVGVGGIKMPAAGIEIGYKVRIQTDKPLTLDPAQFEPAPNQQIVERVVFAQADGTLTTLETSSKLGQVYDPNGAGGRWRQAASEALGVAAGERLPTTDLQNAVIFKEFIIRTIE